ncbi:MAG: transposase [Gammaproteobacteria bacterium]|nr:transposase [Gammaproteobacteria bacterium]
MPRLARVSLIGVAQHVIQRGNNRQICFGSEADMAAYVGWLKKFSKQYKVDIHAWVLMSNHVHLLCTPHEVQAVSTMMQSLGRMYVRYFNQKYGRSGTLWEGRFKSCLVQSERYLLGCHRYIELNPVRAKIVDEPSEYRWSSYQCNALGRETGLRTPHELYLKLGRTKGDRLAAYRSLFEVHVSDQLNTDLRKCTNKGLALGDDRFKQYIESLSHQRVTPLKVGRPAKPPENP